MSTELNLLTPKFRVSWPKVFKPETNMQGELEYSLAALFPKGQDLSALEKAVEFAINKKWGASRPTDLKLPFKDQGTVGKKVGDKKVLYQGYEPGAKYATLTSKNKPGVVSKRGEKVTPIDEVDFYAGCWAVAMVYVNAYEIRGNKGVNLKVSNILKMADDTPFTGRPSPEESFASVVCEEPEATDVTQIFG